MTTLAAVRAEDLRSRTQRRPGWLDDSELRTPQIGDRWRHQGVLWALTRRNPINGQVDLRRTFSEPQHPNMLILAPERVAQEMRFVSGPERVQAAFSLTREPDAICDHDLDYEVDAQPGRVSVVEGLDRHFIRYGDRPVAVLRRRTTGMPGLNLRAVSGWHIRPLLSHTGGAREAALDEIERHSAPGLPNMTLADAYLAALAWQACELCGHFGRRACPCRT